MDGQQRLVSLFAALEGLEIHRNSGKKDNFSDIYIDLNANESEEIVTTSVKNLHEKTFIRLTELLRGSLLDLTAFPKNTMKSWTGTNDAAIDSKLTQDVRRIDQILKGESPNYDWKVDTSHEHMIDNGTFNPNASFNKAILCIMASQTPRSFKNNKIVRIGSDWLKRSNRKN